MNKNGEKTKLLAVIAIFAMVLCAMAVAMPVADADGDDEKSTYMDLVTPSNSAKDVYTFDELKSALEDDAIPEIVINTVDKDGENTSFTIDENLTIPEGKKVFIGEAYIPNGVMGTDDAFVADETTFTLTIGEDVTITVAGEIYNNIGKNKATVPIVLNGNIEFDGGALYSVCALPGATGHVTGAFFTNSNGNTKWTDGGYNNIQYKHMYSSDVADILPYVNSVAYNNVNVSGDRKETAAKAIFTYGDVTVSANVNMNGKTLVVGGISGADATVTFAKGVQFDGTVMNAKDGSSATITGLKAGEDGFTIGQGSITISGTFTGSAINITATGQVEIDGEVVKDGTTQLVKDRDYTLSYNNNVNAGTASVTITGKGNYTGSKTVNFKIGKAMTLKEGNDVTIIACGVPTRDAYIAGDMLEEQGVSAQVINMHTLKPIDEEAIIEAAVKTRRIVTVEEHNVIGGLGDAVASVLAQSGKRCILTKIGIPDEFGPIGKPEDLYAKYKLSSQGIMETVMEIMGKEIEEDDWSDED